MTTESTLFGLKTKVGEGERDQLKGICSGTLNHQTTASKVLAVLLFFLQV